MDNVEMIDVRDNREKLLLKIMEVKFYAYDLALYLDTHPEDRRALKLHHDMVEKLKILEKQYEDEYGPLTMETNMNSWEWIETPWPWERRANI